MKKLKVFKVRVAYDKEQKKLVPLVDVKLPPPDNRVIKLDIVTIPIGDPDRPFPLVFKGDQIEIVNADIVIYGTEKKVKGEITLLKKGGRK